MPPDNITSDTLFASGGVMYGPRVTVHFRDLYTSSPVASGATLEQVSPETGQMVYDQLIEEVVTEQLRRTHEDLTSTYRNFVWSYDSNSSTFYSIPLMGVVTSAPEPLMVASTPSGQSNIFMERINQVTVNELIGVGEATVTRPATSGGYFVDYEPVEISLRPGGNPFVETEQRYRMGVEADADGLVTAQQAAEGFDRLTRIHGQNLQTELHSTDDHISYTVNNAADSVHQLEHVICVFDSDARTAIQRDMLEEAVTGRYDTVLSDNMIMPESNVIRTIDVELERQRVHALADYTEEDGRIHVKDQDELKALMDYIEISNPRVLYPPAPGKSWYYRMMNDKYTYVEEQTKYKDYAYTVEYSVYDRYGKYTVTRFLELNRDEPEYRDMCEKINWFNGKDEEDE